MYYVKAYIFEKVEYILLSGEAIYILEAVCKVKHEFYRVLLSGTCVTDKKFNPEVEEQAGLLVHIFGIHYAETSGILRIYT